MHGKLIKWKDDRGFGFILCEHNQQQVFVHISAFPTSSPRPKVGELLDFDIETTADGKTRAINISREDSLKTKTSPIKLSKTPNKTTKKISLIIALILVVLIAVSVSQ
ncbi:MAG: cold shock domain-containing protein [Methylophaga sp.]|uniref:cold shock domain-containing protein n=1 Tax=Methylophaga sp. TaxID=2024840 RepID=UPI000C114788|nr:cold shock domain-containing protein [Methylophaga sp.]MBL1457052.1 cold shock domain-containing protein [Methylophaga sp.]